MVKGLDKIQDELMKKLSGKKFLIVLDDVWVISRWDQLIGPLSSGLAGSIVIVTTRDQNIARTLGTMPIVTLTGLEKNYFWDFFVQTAFMGQTLENPTLVSIGQEIAAKLHGIPLAAKTVGRLLNKKLDEEHWLSILNSNLWKLRQAPDDIMPVLMLSYQNLSVPVQRCFAYCSVFPKDHFFSKRELICTWIAQGFIEIRPGNHSPEHVAQEYLNELISSSFFQLKFGYYLIHDLLHDLAISVSNNECHVMNNELCISMPPSVRHLCVPYSAQTKEKCRYYSLIQFGNEQSDCQSKRTFQTDGQLEVNKLRTLIFTNFSDFFRGINEPESITLRCNSIANARVLISPYTSKGAQLAAMHNLIHLRYLDLSFSRFENLPESICLLYHLQTLIVHQCRNLLHLPKDITNLIMLRHLIADEGRHYLGRIPKIGKMTCLQELDAFYIQKDSGHKITELKGLQELRGSLRIHNLENVEIADEACLAKLKEKRFLIELWITWDDPLFPVAPEVSSDVLKSLWPPPYLQRLYIVGYNGTHYPTWLSDNSALSCLTSLYLRDWSGWQSLPPLGHLQCLRKLEIISLNSVQKVGYDFYGFSQGDSFPRLKELAFESMPNWHQWEGLMQRQLFPCLENLIIRYCPKLEYVPIFQLQEQESSRSFPVPNRQDIQHFPTRSLLPFNLHFCTPGSPLRLRILPGLKKLTVMKSPNFAPVCKNLLEGGLQRPGSTMLLEELHISCSSFLVVPICCNLTSLVHLTMSHLDDGHHKMLALTDEQETALLHLKSLKVLVFRNCENLQFLPATLYSMRNLKELHVVKCGKVRSLPDNGLPALLEVLMIDRNSELDKRLHSAERHKIAHIGEVKYS